MVKTRLTPSGTAVGAALALLLMALSPYAGATDTKASGDWLNLSIWTAGVPAAGGFANILGHTLTLQGPANTALVYVDGLLTVKGSDPPAAIVGSLTVSTELSVGFQGAGELMLSLGGQLNTANTAISARPGSAGLVTVDGSPSLLGARSSWINQGQLFIGSSGFGAGTGQVKVVNGGSVSSFNTSVGSGVSVGTLEVSNSTWTNANLLRVGSGGSRGTLLLNQRGIVNTFTGIMGYGSGSTGSLTNTLGEAMVDNATWANAGDFYAGYYARAQIDVRNGGLLNNAFGYVGYGETAVASVTISNATWTNRNALLVGYNGKGTVLVERGASLTSLSASLGLYGSSEGSVTVDDARWTNTGHLVVGEGIGGASSKGELLVRNGGSVSASQAIIANDERSQGRATVTGLNASGAASAWNISGDLLVGHRGQGILTVADGGIVRSASTFLGYYGVGSLMLNGTAGRRGTLETGQLANGLGVGPQIGSLQFDGGQLRATSDQNEFLRNFGLVTVRAGGAFIDSNQHRIGIEAGFTGAGGLTKLGLGVLDLRGASFLGGLSTIEAGTLAINGSLTGPVQVNSGATLAGNGRVYGLVTVLPGGIVSPGNSPGTLTLDALVMGPASSLLIELGSPGDHLVVLGDVTLAGVINFAGDATALTAGTFQGFLSYSGMLTNHGIQIGSLPSGLDPTRYVLDFSTPGMLGLGVAAAVPEPGTALLLALGGGLLLCRVRRIRPPGVVAAALLGA